MVSFLSAHKKLKTRSLSKRRKKRLEKRQGGIECVCKKSKATDRRGDIVIGGKILTRKEKDSPVNLIRLKRAKGMNVGAWALIGGYDNPCRCSIVSGELTRASVPKKKRVLKGVSHVTILWR